MRPAGVSVERTEARERRVEACGLRRKVDVQSARGYVQEMKKPVPPLTGAALIKEAARRIRLARSHWDAHDNGACRRERERALVLYESLSKEERQKIPQALRVWLRYRSEKYFGEHRTPSAAKRGGAGGRRP